MQTVSRLLDQFIPNHYSLSLDINRVGRKFTGTVSIQGEVAAEATAVALHAKELEIEAALIDGRTASVTAGENDEIYISQEDLQSGAHTIVLRFHGMITDAMHGLYPCYYEHAGVKKELIATQFESHHAREVFPCVDEPAAKATFDLTLTTEDDITVLGNMPISSQDTDGRRLTTRFQTTPRMSTYLLAFVAGELQKKTAKTKNGVEVNIFATPAQPAASLDFALDIATRTIDFYDEYFDTPYPLPKSDHVALPDFSSGAMENWGLVTYREIALLADPATTGISSKQYIATVIAHELAHQWFGNLVTMQWWNDLWLNESFATMIEYLAVDHLHPEWNMWLDFATNESVMALRRDAIDGVQSVQIDVNHPDEITTLFDGAIVYAKGARLLRMLQHYVGDEAFQKGLRAYFTKHAYGNTAASDLWEALADASGKDIVTLMSTWISQPGYPVITATKEGDTITLEQSQFFVGPHKKSDALWPVPLNASVAAAPELLEQKSARFEHTDNTLLQLNVGATAHFITQYDETLRADLLRAAQSGDLSEVDRAQLLNDATLLARGGKASSSTLIALLGAYRNETNEQVWGIMSMALGELKKFVEDNEAAEKKLRALAAGIAKQQYERLGWEAKPGEPEEDTKLRAIAVGMTLYGEEKEAIETAKQLFESTPLEALDPELRPAIISTVARHGDDSVVDDLLADYKETTSSELKNDICLGITSTRSQDKIELLLATIKNSAIVRPQDVGRWFAYLIRSRESRAVAWSWLEHNWAWIERTFGGDKSYDDYPRYAAGALTTKAQLEAYKAFFEPLKDTPALTRVITMGISEIEGRVALIERDKADVQDMLMKL